MENKPVASIEWSSSIKEIATALAKFQGEVKNVKAQEENDYFHSNYATLDAVVETIKEPLSKNGLSYTQWLVGSNQLVTILMHTSGEYIRATAELNPKDKMSQSVGSALTYMRRYTLASILGVAPEEDDDGNQATGEPAKKTPTTVKKGKNLDLFADALARIQKAKTVAEVTTLAERIEQSEEFTIDQKDKLDKEISARITQIDHE